MTLHPFGFPHASAWLCQLLLLTGLTMSTCDAFVVGRQSGATVKTSLGAIKGFAGRYAHRYVVPYAQAPVGQLRFKDPVAITSLSSFDSSGLPPACPQSTPVASSEDCLYMTVYTPTDATPSSKLPVLFWVHGGSFMTGSTTAYGLDGSDLAFNEDIIVVTVQYRLGLLGFMRSDALGLSGNYGLKDIISALDFVKNEIGAFGGDASRVTLAGQSSGAELVKTLLVTPSASSLFARAILHSAPLDFTDQSVEIGNSVGQFAASQIGCNSEECLRNAPVSSILNVQNVVYGAGQAGALPGLRMTESFIRPVVDGALVTKDFRDLTLSGDSLDDPSKQIILTTMRDDGALAIYGLFPQPQTPALFEPMVRGFYGSRAPAIMSSEIYTPKNYSKASDAARDAFTLVGTDFNWLCANQHTAVNLTAAGQRAVYEAVFDLGISFTNRTVEFTAKKPTHQDDIYVLFHPTSINLTRAQRVLVKEVQARWAAFVKTGSPNLSGYANWAAVGGRDELNVLRLGNTTEGRSVSVKHVRPEACAIGTGVYTPA